MDTDNDSGNRYAFKLGESQCCVLICLDVLTTHSVDVVFEDSDVNYFFMANFAKEQDEWIRLLSMAGYDFNLMKG